MWRYFSSCLVLCAIIEIKCWSGDNLDAYRSSMRLKRAKHNYIPSYKKYYDRPNYSYSMRSPFIYSSSHGYSSNDVGLPNYKLRPYKVSKKTINEGLGDDDFNNLIKHLSHKDLDKIVEFSNKREKYSDNYRDSESNEYSDIDNYDIPSIDYQEDSSYPSDPHMQPDYKYKIADSRPSTRTSEVQNMYIQTADEDTKLSLLNEHIQKEINSMSNRNNIFTDSSTLKEEELPKPLNLREADYDVSFTNNVPSVVRPESTYRLENFGDLPLMDYKYSILEKVNSYSVPHYSVISASNQRPRFPASAPLSSRPSSTDLSTSILSLINAPEVEPAPPASTAQEQSDAHLKAIKIWTHKSKGTAYTLHDDGTLSLEQPLRPNYN